MYLVIKLEDAETLLTPWYKKQLKAITRRIERKREEAGKVPVNTYIVNNTDEPFIEEICNVMRRNGVILREVKIS